jgi:hypothetical protein
MVITELHAHIGNGSILAPLLNCTLTRVQVLGEQQLRRLFVDNPRDY